ncbi:MAG: beta-lactamase domain protein [Gemmatimonadetes bacterium]|nr:beta-lactamase domain protein [Gemmatimonadota bacterium]
MQLFPARQLAGDLWCLDLDFQGRPGVVAAYLITGPDGHTLLETGPGSTLEALERGVAAAGARMEEITQLVVTHIHLDHAGAAGSLLRRLPEARLFVHPLGAPHMIDPSRLLASATRIYAERMQTLWGAFEPCPAERVTTLDDGAQLACGARTLVALHTPGHASHHIAFHHADEGTVFVGDVGGVRLSDASYVRPPTPPPDIDIEAWHRSIAAIRALAPRTLDLTHFGRFHDPERHLDELTLRLDAWVKWTAERLARGDTPAAMTTALRTASEVEIQDDGHADEADAYELATPSGMTVDGLVRYLTRRPKSATPI